MADVPPSLRRDGPVALGIVAVVLAAQWPFRQLCVSLLDEGAVLQTAAEVARGKVPYVDAFHYVFPGVFYLAGGTFALAGTSMETARLLAFTVFAVATGLAYLIARWFAPPLTALTMAAVFLVYRVWAYPQWQILHYSSLAMMLLLLSAWMLGVASEGRRGLACAGAVSGLAVLAKQDSGGIGTIALGVAVLLFRRPAVRSAVAFTAGWLAVVGTAIALLAAVGAGPDFVEQAIRRPLSSNFSFDYPAWPSLWGLGRQDPVLRASPFSYVPPVLAELHWQTIVQLRPFRETGLFDAALKLVFNMPWLVCVAGAVAVTVAALRGRAGTTHVRRLGLLVLLAAGSVVAFNPPHDWPHCLVLYPPTLLLAFALAAPMLRRPAGSIAAGAVITCALAVSVKLAIDLDAHFDTPVHTERGTLRATAPQATALQELVRAVAETPPPTPLLALPYHPLVNFLSARSSPTRYGILWPADPPRERDAEVVRALDRMPASVVVYSLTQAPFLPRMDAFAPVLFEYLVDHYTIARVVGGDPRGYAFLLLERRRPRAGVSLLGGMLAQARVTAEDRTAPDVHAPLASETRWPFLPVLRVTTLPGTTVSVAYRIVPEPGQRLEAFYGVNPERWLDVPPPRTRFAIAVRDGEDTRDVWSAEIDPTLVEHDRRWAPVTVDLAPWTARPIELVLRVSGAPGAPVRADSAGWGDPRLVRQEAES
jgi:hypothetical protein